MNLMKLQKFIWLEQVLSNQIQCLEFQPKYQKSFWHHALKQVSLGIVLFGLKILFESIPVVFPMNHEALFLASKSAPCVNSQPLSSTKYK